MVREKRGKALRLVVLSIGGFYDGDGKMLRSWSKSKVLSRGASCAGVLWEMASATVRVGCGFFRVQANIGN